MLTKLSMDSPEQAWISGHGIANRGQFLYPQESGCRIEPSGNWRSAKRLEPALAFYMIATLADQLYYKTFNGLSNTMNIQNVSRFKDKFLLLIVDWYHVAQNRLFAFITSVKPFSMVQEDFAERTALPSSEEYLKASNSQIVQRIYNNLPEPINEQVLIDKILNLRSDELRERQIKHMAVGLYTIAIALVVLVFKVSLGYSINDIKVITEKETEYRAEMIKKDLDFRLQSKEQEIRELTDHLDRLQKNQEELQKEIILLTKNRKQVSKTVSDKNQGKEKQRQ